MKTITDFDCCPHCGTDSGYYTKDYISGRATWNRSWNGTEADNSEKYDYLNCKEGKVAYCQDCDKRICRLDAK